MNDTRGTTNQKPPDPSRLSAAHLYLLAGTVLATIALVLYCVDIVSTWDMHRGTYPLLVAAIVLCGCAWIVEAAASRARQSRMAHIEAVERRIEDRLAELTSAVRQVRDEAARQRITYLPAAESGRLYASVGIQRGTAPCIPPLDEETAAAIRRLNMRLLKDNQGD